MKSLLILLLGFGLGISLVSCKTGMISGKSYRTEGWINQDTFRVIAIGVPKKGLVNRYQRKATSKEAALTMAQKRIVEKFIGAIVKGVSGVKNARSIGIAVSKEFSGVVKGGSIIKSTFDNEDNCEIVYEIEQKGLKKSLQSVAERIKEQ